MQYFLLLRCSRKAPESALCKNMMSSTKPEIHNIAMPSEEGRATDNNHAHAHWRRSVMWFLRYASRQKTNGRTYHNTLV